jgi:hypothetical protein
MKYILIFIFLSVVLAGSAQSQTGITQETNIEIVGDTSTNQYVIKETRKLDNGYTQVSIEPENGTYTLEDIKEIAVQRGIQLQRQIALSEARAMRISNSFDKLNNALKERGVDYSRETNKRFYRALEGPWLLFINSADNSFNLTAKGDQNGNLVFRYKNQIFPATVLSERSLIIKLPDQLGGAVQFYLQEKDDAKIFFSKGEVNEYAIIKR